MVAVRVPRRAVLLSRENVPYDSMYPLCLLPVVPSGVPYHNIIDKKLIDAMFDKQFFPSSSEALSFRLKEGMPVWNYLRFRMGDAISISPAHFVAYLACMTRGEAFSIPVDFSCIESYLEKPLPREVLPRGNISKSVFVHMLFSLANLPSPRLLRWLLLVGRAIRRVAL